MTTYRVYVEKNGPSDWVEYVEAESEQHAKAQVADDPNDWPYLAAAPLPDAMEYECVCSVEPVPFKRIIGGDPHETELWECQNCFATWLCPPDEINWENERMFAEGYMPCGCQSYNVRCRCRGAGWFRLADDDDDGEDDGPWDAPTDDDEEGSWDPYYELEGYFEMDTELTLEDSDD